jgi:hypothetical protein
MMLRDCATKNTHTIRSLCVLLFLFPSIVMGQNVKDHLLLHIPFDGDGGLSIKTINTSDQYTFRPIKNNIIERSTRIYARNDVLKIGTIRDSIILKGITQFPLSVTFWVKITGNSTSDTVINIGNIRFGKYQLLLKEKRSTVGENTVFTLRLFRPSELRNETKVDIKTSSKEWQLFTIQVDEQGQMKFSVSNTIIDDTPSDLFKIANPIVAFSAPNLNISDVFKNGAQNESKDFVFAFYPKRGQRNIYIDDIRVYNKVLTREDLTAIAANDPYLGTYIGKYQLAYTYKQLADQYYLQSSDITRNTTTEPALNDSAKYYYTQARKAMLDAWIDQSTAEGIALYKRLTEFQFTNNQDLDSISRDLHRAENKIRNSLQLKNNYDLLLFDINYRIKLIEAGYSFWGKEFTENPMFPVQEYQFFNDAFSKFNTTYQRIETLLKYQGELDEKQEMNELQSQLAAHKSELEKIRIDETQFKVGFYDQQLGNIDSRLKGIEERQKYLTREVDRKEQTLKELDAKIMSQLSTAISQATLGVPIDVSRDLRGQLTQAGLSYLAGDGELATSLLGSYKDIYDVAITAREYYRKGKDAFETIRSVASGKITVDNVLKIGDAVANSGFVDESWQREWDQMKRTYNDVQEQYKKGKELLQKIQMTARNPNMKNIVDFVDWMAQSEYIPENYRKEYEQFKNYREAAYAAVKDKRYDDIIKLGVKMINDPDLTAEINRIRQKVIDLKPAFIIVEMVKNKDYESIKELVIKNILDGTADQFLNEKIKNEFLYKIFKDYLHQDTIHGQSHFESLIMAMVNNSPETFLECFPYVVREDLTKLLTARSYQDLVAKLKTFKFSDYRNKIKIMHDTLFLYDEPYVMDISKYLNFDREALRTIVGLYRANSDLYDKLKNATTPLDIYKIFESVVIDQSTTNGKAEQLFNLINGQLNAAQKDQVIQETTAFYLGNGVFQAAVDPSVMNNQIQKIPDLVDENNPNEVQGENMGSMPQADNSALMRQMAAKALDMAFPGVGTAVNTVLNIADAIFDGYQIVDQLRGIYTEKVRLNEEYVKLMDNYRDNQFNKQIALYETRIANLSYDIMMEEHEGYSKIVNNIVDRKKDIRRKIGGHLPMMFFYAERLRFYYQRLNKASTFWYGNANSLNSIIFKDQNNLRLAIDPDIRLYDWISQPDVTSSREDLYRLFSYWSRIYTLVSDGIISNKLKYGENLAEISYQVLDLETIVPEQWQDFQRWQRHPNSLFTFDLDLSHPLSSNNSYGFDSAYTSIKTLQVIPLAIDASSQRLQNLVLVTNVGLSTNEAGVVEPLAKKTRSSADEFIEIDKNGNVIVPTYYTKNLKYRWGSPGNDYQPYNFEGYNLRSEWKVSIEPRSNAEIIHKLYFIVFYQFTKNYSNLHNTLLTEYAYRVKLPYNVLKDTKEYLNVTLSLNPQTEPPAVQYQALLKKYPYLQTRVQPADLQPYVDQNNQPLIIAKQNENFRGFSTTPIEEPKKKKCFISRLF